MATKALVRKVNKFVTVAGGKTKPSKKVVKLESSRPVLATNKVAATNKVPLRVVSPTNAGRPVTTRTPVTAGRPQTMVARSIGNAAPAFATQTAVITEAPKVVKLFKQGDKVVYPGHGVGEINSVMSRTIAATEQSFYDITIIESGMKIMVPVHQAQAVGLRKVIDRKAIEEVYTILRNRNFKIDTQTWNRRFREYSQKIKTGSVFEIAEVLRDLSVLGADKELSFGEKKMLDVAQGLLVSELAIAKARPHDKIIGELKEIFA